MSDGQLCTANKAALITISTAQTRAICRFVMRNCDIRCWSRSKVIYPLAQAPNIVTQNRAAHEIAARGP